MSAGPVLYWDPTNPGRVSCEAHGSMRLERHDRVTPADHADAAATYGDVIVCEDATAGGCADRFLR